MNAATMSRLLASLGAVLATGALAAAEGEREVQLSGSEWLRLSAALVFPAAGLAVRGARTVEIQSEPRRLVAEIDSDYVEQTSAYRRYYSVSCSRGRVAWHCAPASDMVEPAGGGAVLLRRQASAQDVVRLARYLGHAPGHPKARELVAVESSGMDYRVSYRMRGCWHAVHLRREGELFRIADPRESVVSACS